MDAMAATREALGDKAGDFLDLWYMDDGQVFIRPDLVDRLKLGVRGD